MRVLLVGKTGQLGGDIIRNWDGAEIIAPSRQELDLGDPQATAAFIAEEKPAVVINTAAFHNVPLCEMETDNAFRINAVAVRDMATACRRIGATFVTFSTDYVFGGEKRTPYNEDDLPSPLQMYGISRVAGEYAALAAAPEHSIIIRTCGLYGRSGATSKGGNFVDKRLQDAAATSRLEMGCDQTVSPTSTNDLAGAVLQLVRHPRREPGIYHLVNEGSCTWYEFTKAIYEIADITTELVPVDRGGVSGSFRRPLYSVLQNNRARRLGIVMPHWRDALERYLTSVCAEGLA